MLLAALLAAASDYTRTVLRDEGEQAVAFRLGLRRRPRRRVPLSIGNTREALFWARRAWEDDLRFRGAPAPTQYLDSGMQGGFVFRTVDPDVVVRVGLDAGGNQYEDLFCFPDPDLASGMVRSFGCWERNGIRVTWKERVDTDVEGFLLRRYSNPEERDPAMRALVGLYGAPSRNLAILRRYPETAGLARAIRNGLPTDDLDLTQNLGVTKDGRVVAYDL